MKALHSLLETCNEQLKQEPENWDLIKLRGVLNNVVGQYDEAILDLSRIINHYPNDVSAYYVRSHCYFSKQQYALAKQDYLIAMKIEDKSDIKSAKEWTEKVIAGTAIGSEEEIENMKKILEYERRAALINFTFPLTE